jgi:hypothetical protein
MINSGDLRQLTDRITELEAERDSLLEIKVLAQAVVDACLGSNLPRSRWIPEMDNLKAALEKKV